MKDTTKRTLLALVPLLVLIGLLALDIYIFGADSIKGPEKGPIIRQIGRYFPCR